jgi:hypothetical protein
MPSAVLACRSAEVSRGGNEFDLEQLQEFGDRHGIPRDEVISRMGGSP